jgi:hypothetical protein
VLIGSSDASDRCILNLLSVSNAPITDIYEVSVSPSLKAKFDGFELKGAVAHFESKRAFLVGVQTKENRIEELKREIASGTFGPPLVPLQIHFVDASKLLLPESKSLTSLLKPASSFSKLTVQIELMTDIHSQFDPPTIIAMFAALHVIVRPSSHPSVYDAEMNLIDLLRITQRPSIRNLKILSDF